MNSRELFRLYRDGLDQAATAIFDRYVGRLIALIRSRVSPKLSRRIDPEDVVQSAYRSFFVRAEGGAFQVTQSGDLWRLLAGISLNKLYGQIEKQTAAKRDIRAEEAAEYLAVNAECPEPSAVEILTLVEQLQLVMARLAPEEREILTLTLQGESAHQIGAALGKSERTVHRHLASARRKVERQFVESNASPKPSTTHYDAPLNYADFILERLLGSGGMGKVFRAREVTTGRTVAVKALHKGRQADARAVSQFVQECRILSSLRHPNLVGVEGLGRFPGGGYFIVMEYFDGPDLQTRLDSRPFSLDEAASIVRQVCKAISYAHGKGIIHCDLKPGNVLMGNGDRVAVTDFGFAFLTVDAASASTRRRGGTLGYIAPEVLTSHDKPTPAADIYAIGMLFWALITGHLPSEGSLSEVEQALAPVASLVSRCTAKHPSHRIQSAEELHWRICELQRS